ncbi:hypothetical protein LTR37_010892 [Vermiconidia calcicola]|uniref:Uncharacterized protein n=1 Tax=Vermiconidia calcicola TaxID=1690605 RepID=A0ACC3N4B6_9PEZI|nr:hypothetical protein LTR37_010892 [Vermiconidia calcicola]
MTTNFTFSAEEWSESYDILQGLFAGRCSPQSTAEKLASLTLSGTPDRTRSPDDNDYHGIDIFPWTAIISAAQDLQSQIPKLVDLMVCMSKLPAPRDPDGKQVVVYAGRIWDDLPEFGWEANSIWNSRIISPKRLWLQLITIPGRDIPTEPGAERQTELARFLNANEFIARLESTGIRDNKMFALWTFSEALEIPIDQAVSQRADLEAAIPAAAIWVQILGPQIFRWTKVFQHGGIHGAPGSGGPLWHGKHGFCKERWGLWRERFGELSRDSRLSDELREVAAKSENKMAEIEEQEVHGDA